MTKFFAGIGMFVRAAVVVPGVILFITSLPDLVRYIRIKQM